MGKKRLRSWLVAVFVTFVGCAGALAQPIGVRPVTIVVPFQAGTPTDIVARALGQDLGELIGVPVIVDNRPGASQTVAGVFLTRAPADGHTLMLANLPAIVAPTLQEKLPYRGIRDFTAISHIADVSLALVTSPSIQATSLQEFVNLLRASPGTYTYFSAGVGSPIHMLAEMFNVETGIKATHVPYKGVPGILPDLMAGRISYGFLQTGALEHARSGKIKAMAIVARDRDAIYPEVPTMGEAGMTQFVYTVPYVLVAPKGIPAKMVDALNAAVSRVMTGASFQTKLKAMGVQTANPKTATQSADFIEAEEKRWDDTVKKARIQLE